MSCGWSKAWHNATKHASFSSWLMKHKKDLILRTKRQCQFSVTQQQTRHKLWKTNYDFTFIRSGCQFFCCSSSTNFRRFRPQNVSRLHPGARGVESTDPRAQGCAGPKLCFADFRWCSWDSDDTLSVSLFRRTRSAVCGKTKYSELCQKSNTGFNQGLRNMQNRTWQLFESDPLRQWIWWRQKATCYAGAIENPWRNNFAKGIPVLCQNWSSSDNSVANSPDLKNIRHENEKRSSLARTLSSGKSVICQCDSWVDASAHVFI